MVNKYKNLASLILFSNQQKKLKKDIQKVLKNDSKKRAIVLYIQPIQDIVLYNQPIQDIVLYNQPIQDIIN
jgi:hypothetical protein